MKENTVGWLKDFADKEGEKIAKQNGIDPNELKKANYMDNILDIVNRKKKTSVDEKVAKYRELVGLDLVMNIEKEGGKEIVASCMKLSSRHKNAQQMDHRQTMDDIKQYVDQVIKNRNGIVATPALLDQLEHYMGLDKDWLRANYEVVEKIIEDSRKKFQPQDYNELSINDLARTDDRSQDEESAPFLQGPSGG